MSLRAPSLPVILSLAKNLITVRTSSANNLITLRTGSAKICVAQGKLRRGNDRWDVRVIL
jgi:hypothetical protein